MRSLNKLKISGSPCNESGKEAFADCKEHITYTPEVREMMRNLC